MAARPSVFSSTRGRLAARRKKCAAFTLIELISVISILGILAAIAGPTFFSTQPFAERGYADEVASALRTAQKIAVASRDAVRFSIDANGYQVTRRAVSNAIDCAGPWPNAVTLSDGSTLSGTTPAGVAVSAAQLVFSSAGNVCGQASTTINIGAKPFVINIDGASGFVQVP